MPNAKEKAAREYSEACGKCDKSAIDERIDAFIAGYDSRQPEIDHLRKDLEESKERERIATKVISDQRKEAEKLRKDLKKATEWVDMEDDGRPEYYENVLVQYTGNHGNFFVTVAHLVSDGDKYTWVITGTDVLIDDYDVHLWRHIDPPGEE